MNITEKLLADFIIIGIICGLYLQYRGFKIMKAVPAGVKRKHRALTRDEAPKLVASLAYAFLGAWFETLSVSRAVFS